MNRMISFLLAQGSLGGMSGVGPRSLDGGEPDGALNRRRETYRSLPPGEHLMEMTSVEIEERRVLVRGRRIATNPLEAERFAKAEAKRARKGKRRIKEVSETLWPDGAVPWNSHGAGSDE